MPFISVGRRARRRVFVWLLACATIGAALLTPATAAADTFRWIKDADGDWNDAANWEHTIGNVPGPGYPDGLGDVADFPLAFQAERTITIPENRTITLGGISVRASPTKIKIAGGTGALLILATGGAASAVVSNFLEKAELTLDVRVELFSDLSVVAGTDAIVRFKRTITEAAFTGTHSITKSWPGTLILEQPAFHGRGTRVEDGELSLQSLAGASLVHAATLEIGDGTGAPQSARVVALASTQFHSSATVQVNRDGVLHVFRPNQVGDLVVTDGVVRVLSVIGAAVKLTLSTLTMTGGLLEVADGVLAPGRGELVIEGDITATASAAGPARIRGPVGAKLDLDKYQTTFSVNDGPGAVDLDLGISVAAHTFAKDGPGTLRFTGDSHNDFWLDTYVYGGRLELARSPGRIVVPGSLWIFGGEAPTVVSILGGVENRNNIAAGGHVYVFRNGHLQVNSSESPIGHLGIYDGGRVVLGAEQKVAWRVSRLEMASGGRLTTTGGTNRSWLRLISGIFVLRSDSGLPAVIDGGGLLTVDALATMQVQDGPPAIDLRVDVEISGYDPGDFGPLLTKVGEGTALIEASSSLLGGFRIFEGTLLLTGSHVGTIQLAGGTLGGTGTVAGVVGDIDPRGTAGTLSPGFGPGRFTTGPVAFVAINRFAVELNGTTPGTGYDQLAVTGTVSLGNATLLLTVGAAPPPSARFRIIDNDGTDPITGTFAGLAEGSAVTIGGHRFTLSYRGGDGNDVVLTAAAALGPGPTPEPTPEPEPTPGRVTYFLAEGATGEFFDEDVLIVNPNDAEAPVTLTFLAERSSTAPPSGLAAPSTPARAMPLAERSSSAPPSELAAPSATARTMPLREGGATVVEKRTIAPQSRMTVHVDQIAGLEDTSASVQVVSDKRLPLVVERSMFWDASYYGGHTATAVAQPETRWIFAEGSQGDFFDTYFLIANANAEATTATLTFLREHDAPVVKTVEVAPFSRKTVGARDYPEVVGPFGAVVETTRPVIAERAMYFASLPARPWTGGHVNTGIAAPSTTWFHAEGATGKYFNTFILLSNPQDTSAQVELRFLLDTGAVITRTKTLAPRQRMTINPATEDDARLENAALSTVVQSDVPIVSERSMYWQGDAEQFGEGHNSSGVVSTATRWGLAEGRVGGPREFVTYILLANPSTTAAEVTITYLRESGAPIVKTYTVPPTSRYNVDVKFAVPELQDASFGARIDVTNDIPIAVERSVYWNANGVPWAGGSNALATPLP